MIILGIDPGFGITGYGLIETNPQQVQFPRLLEAGILTTKKNNALSERLLEIHDHLLELFKEFTPQAMAMEEIFSVGAFPRSAIQIGNVHGVVQLAAAQNSVPISLYYPIQVKKALLGFGHGTKQQIQRMVQRTLQLAEVPKPDDVADALAVALCHANRLRDA